MKNISVNFSAPQSSPLGKAIGDLYYKTNLLGLLDRSKVVRTGFPHNGGMHSLSITGDPQEIIDFIGVLKETFGPVVEQELWKIRKELLSNTRVVYMKLADKNLGD